MNILFFVRRNLWSYGLPDGLRDLGHTVGIAGSIYKRSIPALIKSFKPDLLVTVGWGPDHSIRGQKLMRKYATRFHIPLVYWSTEDPNFTEIFTLPLVKRMKPDFIFTISEKTVETFRKLGFPAAHMDFGYHSKIHRRVKKMEKYKADIAVVANAYPDVLHKHPQLYRRRSIDILIRPLLKRGMKIDFYGRNWHLMKPYLGRSIPKSWIKGHVDYKDAYKVYSSAKIVLGLQNYRDMVTQRTYEILGSGGFLLTCDTPGVRRLVKPGQDVALSSSPEETVRLVEYYLKNDEEREKIRRQGRIAISEHSYTNRARQMLTLLEQYGLGK